MLIPELIQRAIAGQLRFDFIEATVTALDGPVLSSMKGRGHADPADSSFQFHFLPRGPFVDAWTRDGGYLDAESDCRFVIAGVERGSATWTAQTTAFRRISGVQGPALVARTGEWSRTDERSVHSSFMRLVIPGRHLYPTTVRHLAGGDARTASVSLDGVDVSFRDHRQYTEICATGTGELADHFPACVVYAFAHVLGYPVSWVYKEWHKDRRRQMTVRLADAPVYAPAATDSFADISGRRYRDFWADYASILESTVAAPAGAR